MENASPNTPTDLPRIDDALGAPRRPWSPPQVIEATVDTDTAANGAITPDSNVSGNS